MNATLSIEIATEPLERVTADLAVVGVFADERPLRGSAGRLDWRLCGFVSDLLVGEHFTGALGDVVLIPTCGRLRVPKVLVLGLGGYRARRSLDVAEVTREAVSRGLDLGTRRVAFSPPGAAAEDFGSHAADLVRGAREAYGAPEVERSVDLLLCTEPSGRTVRALEEALEELADPAVRFLRPRPPGPAQSSPRGVSPL